MNFKQWKQGYIKGHLSLGDKPRGLIYQLIRYFLLNKYRDLTLKYPKIFMLLAGRFIERNIELYEENERLRGDLSFLYKKLLNKYEN